MESPLPILHNTNKFLNCLHNIISKFLLQSIAQLHPPKVQNKEQYIANKVNAELCFNKFSNKNSNNYLNNSNLNNHICQIRIKISNTPL